MNSMYKGITASRVAAAIDLLRSQPKNRQKTIVLVEGGDDFKLFESFVHEQRCIMQIAGDKERVIKALEILDQGSHQGIVGIVDAEYDLIQGQRNVEHNILFTDGHDIETMIISSPSYIKYISSLIPNENFADADRVVNKIHLIVMNIGWSVGTLRLLSHQRKWFLSLNNFMNFIDTQNQKIDIDALIANGWEVAKHKKISEPEIKKIRDELEILGKQVKSEFEWYVYKGHDLTSLIVWAIKTIFIRESPNYDLKKLIGQCDSQKNLEANLRRFYDSRYFRRTSLFKEIKVWEGNNTPYRILDDDL